MIRPIQNKPNALFPTLSPVWLSGFSPLSLAYQSYKPFHPAPMIKYIIRVMIKNFKVSTIPSSRARVEDFF
jgi:hypothetical protein